MLYGKRVLLIIGGGIAAYKSLELIRRLKERGASVRCVLTKAGAEFITPLSVSALSGDKVYQDLFDLTAEAEMGHIQLSREADLLLIAPATADLMAKMVHGRADDLASTVLLATDKPVMIAPAMNVRMWEHPATQRNMRQLTEDGVQVLGPDSGDMACGEYGAGRMVEPDEIVKACVKRFMRSGKAKLSGRRVLVTSGPTHEPIDPVRYLANRSSGKQGVAIAEALARQGAEVIFVTGPAAHRNPEGCEVISVQTALEMRDAARAALPCDAAIFAAAVADWRVAEIATDKTKKVAGKAVPPNFDLVENPDILAEISQLSELERPKLVVGFAAETTDVLKYAQAKLAKKGCDWIVANDVSLEHGVMGGDENTAILVQKTEVTSWPKLSKRETAERLVAMIGQALRQMDHAKRLALRNADALQRIEHMDRENQNEAAR